VRFVIHAGAPQSLEHYQQEAGRAGRDGLEAECVLIVSSGDFLRWRDILSKNGELTEARQGLLRDMERYAARVGCRHRRLVSYFGEAYSKGDCGACDYCLGELEAVPEPATLARKILSAVARVGQRYGAAHVGQVLRGQLNENVRARGHDTLSVFGLLRETSVDDMRGYIDQLLAFGLLRQVGDPYPVLQLTDAGAAALKDAAELDGFSLARQRKPEKGSGPKRSRVEAESWAGVDRALFDELRAMRLRLARERGVPPYVIFHDTTLRELARVRPASLAALREVYGVGARKADDLGPEVLRVLHGG
jgi:ATP-dependent DNA helicase RecQ